MYATDPTNHKQIIVIYCHFRLQTPILIKQTQLCTQSNLKNSSTTAAHRWLLCLIKVGWLLFDITKQVMKL